MSHFDPRWFKAVPDLHSRILFCTLTAFDYFFSYFDLIIYPPAVLHCSQNREKAHREWHFWLGAKLMMVQGWRWGSFQKLSFFPSSRLGSNGLMKDSTSTMNTSKQLNIKLTNKSFVFVQFQSDPLMCILKRPQYNRIRDFTSGTADPVV